MVRYGPCRTQCAVRAATRIDILREHAAEAATAAAVPARGRREGRHRNIVSWSIFRLRGHCRATQPRCYDKLNMHMCTS